MESSHIIGASGSCLLCTDFTCILHSQGGVIYISLLYLIMNAKKNAVKIRSSRMTMSFDKNRSSVQQR